MLDCDASAKWCGRPTRLSPCLTRSRASGLWLMSRGMRMPAEACCRLQGIPACDLVLPDDHRSVRRLMGNAMSLSVVEPLLRAAFVATGLCHPSTPDRWASGRAQSLLVADAWGARAIPNDVLDTIPAHIREHLRGAFADEGSTGSGCDTVSPPLGSITTLAEPVIPFDTASGLCRASPPSTSCTIPNAFAKVQSLVLPLGPVATASSPSSSSPSPAPASPSSTPTSCSSPAPEACIREKQEDKHPLPRWGAWLHDYASQVERAVASLGVELRAVHRRTPSMFQHLGSDIETFFLCRPSTRRGFLASCPTSVRRTARCLPSSQHFPYSV